MIIVALVILAAGYFVYLALNQPSQPELAAQNQVLKLWQAQEIPLVSSDFDLVDIPDSKFTALHDSLNSFKSKSTQASDKALAGIYLVYADLTLLRKENAAVTQRMANLPANQVCSNIPLFQQSADKIKELAEKAIELTQALQSFEQAYPAEFQQTQLTELTPDLDTLQTQYRASFENVNELKRLCG